jgi:GxxExxY protein
MTTPHLLEERLTHSVIGAFYRVYNELGFGFLEHVYTMALERELRARGHAVGRELYVPVFYRGEELTRQRIDMLVDETVVVEAKATLTLHRSASRQVFNYSMRDAASDRAPAALRPGARVLSSHPHTAESYSRSSHVSAVSGTPNESCTSSRTSW